MDKRWTDPIVPLTGILIVISAGILYFAAHPASQASETITLTTTTGMSTVYVTGQLETSYVTNLVSQSVTDPIAVLGLIAVGVVAALVAILASRAFANRPMRD